MEKVKNQYSLYDIFRLALWVLRTKFVCWNAKLFCFPIDIRGRKYIDYGHRLSIGKGCRIDCFDNGQQKYTLKFGDDVQLNDYVHIVGMSSVEIGNNVLMASHVFISDNSHGSYKGDEDDTSPLIPPIKRQYPTSPIKVGDNTWVGEGVMIMPGVTIGKGCVIGAHSIVKDDIPDFCIAIGTPAKAIKKYNFKTKHWERI